MATRKRNAKKVQPTKPKKTPVKREKQNSDRLVLKGGDYSIKELFKYQNHPDKRVRNFAYKELESIFINKPKTGPETKALRNSRRAKVSRVTLSAPDQIFNKVQNKTINIHKLPSRLLPKGVKMLPTSGYEPRFTKLWGSRKQFIEANNCYAYAANQFRFWRPHKAQPGENRQKVHNSPKYIPLKCDEITNAVLRDAGNGAYKCNDPNKACGKGLTKIMMVISPEPGSQDFHFYRQDRDGTWSHKQGWGYGPTKLDASGKVIVDPRYCNRNYGRLNYSKVCSTMCIPKQFKYNI